MQTTKAFLAQSTQLLARAGALLTFITSATIASCSYAETLRITIPHIEQSAPTAVYYPQVLQLALSKTEKTDGPFEVVQLSQMLTKARFEAEVKRKNNGLINVIWSNTNKDLESALIPIRISLLKDLTNYRVFLIRKGDQEKFSRVKSLNDLSTFKAGQGARWTDTEVLTANHLPVTTSPLFEPLFNMLLGKRFDYFPRGLDEIWSEAEMFEPKGIVIEQHLMLNYETARYFFVNKNNPKLAERIERGLRIAIADGSFDKLFYSVPGHKRGYEEIAHKKRLVLKLEPLKE
ncbi:diguanylate cyclase [Cellvibrio sp.]|uniref:diguanylate cyclase n=1 Tax=Cellvibrio sp. TaxID=1965322 RepID=UPI0039648141